MHYISSRVKWGFSYGADFMKQHKDHCDVGVLVGGGDHVQVVVLDECVSAVTGADQGS